MTPPAPHHRPQIVTAGAVLLIVVGGSLSLMNLGLMVFLLFADYYPACVCLFSPCSVVVGAVGFVLISAGSRVWYGEVESLAKVAALAGGIGSLLAFPTGWLVMREVGQMFRHDRFDADAVMELGAVVYPFSHAVAVAVAGFLLDAGKHRYAEWVRQVRAWEPAEADPPETEE